MLLHKQFPGGLTPIPQTEIAQTVVLAFWVLSPKGPGSPRESFCLARLAAATIWYKPMVKEISSVK